MNRHQLLKEVNFKMRFMERHWELWPELRCGQLEFVCGQFESAEFVSGLQAMEKLRKVFLNDDLVFPSVLLLTALID